MTAPTLPEVVTLSIEEIIPYENNPRRIPEEAVLAVKESIERYGYVQPIGVQKSTKEIVVGHTRFQALQQLGVKKIQCYLLDIDDQKAREYRLVDNRTNELTEWDHKSLVLELREWETGLLETFFPNADLEIGQLKNMEVTQEEVDKANNDVTKVREPQLDPVTEVVCPSCTGTFKVKSASLPGITIGDLEELRAAMKEAR